MKTTPLTLRDDLAAAYLRYIDTQYWLRNSGLSRRTACPVRADGNLRSECLLEPVLPYDATVDLLATTAAAGISAESAEIVGRALFGDFTDPGQPVKLRAHQAEAVTSHFRSGSEAGRDVVVTSGTGSGKTERLLCCRCCSGLWKKPGLGRYSPRPTCGGETSRSRVDGVRSARRRPGSRRSAR